MKTPECSNPESIDDGEPAFPLPCGAETMKGTQGMSLRAWFAGQAIVGLLSNSRISELFPDEYAQSAVQYADAVIKALKVKS